MTAKNMKDNQGIFLIKTSYLTGRFHNAKYKAKTFKDLKVETKIHQYNIILDVLPNSTEYIKAISINLKRLGYLKSNMLSVLLH